MKRSLSEEAQALGGAGVEVFADFRQRALRKMFGAHAQQRAAHERQVGQQPGVPTARTVLAHHRVAPPVVADFHPAPVAANQPQPLLRSVFRGRDAAEVVAAFRAGGPGLFERPLAAQHEQAARIGEVGGEGFDRKGVEPTRFDAAVPGFGLDKKGVPFRASNAWACWSRRGWLPLIWVR